MPSLLVGFGLGFFVALQLGPTSLFLIRSTLRRGWVVGLAIGAGIAVVDGLYAALGGAADTANGAVLVVAGVGIGSATWVTLLATGTAAVRRAVGDHTRGRRDRGRRLARALAYGAFRKRY